MADSGFFYRFARIRKKLGLKFNIEMIYLPSEIIVYDSKKSTVVQLSDKDRCYILLSDTLTSGQRVAGEEYRMKNGKTRYEIFRHGSPETKDNTGFIDYPFAQFYGKRLVLLGKQEWDKLSIEKN